ncbi:MAG: GHMP kinase [Eubacterium aggregans]
MRKVEVKVPGSCGEFIQGRVGPDPCLVSCPVDLYSTVTIAEGSATRMMNDKAADMLDLIFREYRLPRSEKHNINIALNSEIPMERGMASSTADLAAVAQGLGAYYDLGLDADRIAQLCIAIEPTDNIMYPELNLFNHVGGQILADYHTHLETPVLIVEFSGRVNTVGFNGQMEGCDAGDIEAFAQVAQAFNQGIATGDLDRIGAACTESARLNQKIIHKPNLETLIALSKAYGGHGVVTGHSGTVIGVMYTDNQFDYQGFMGDFLRLIPKADYDALFLKNIISGGLQTSVQA